MPSLPLPAATVVVLRDSESPPFEVLMVKRHDNVAFMAGAYVFPGGRVDDADSSEAASLIESFPNESRFPDLTPEQEIAFRVAAVRELSEEAGVVVDMREIVPMAHWVTPEVETRRYDTRFFLVRMPHGQEARHDEKETTELAWITPLEAIARCEQDSIMLPPPTWTTLKRLGRFRSIEEVFGWARTTPIMRVQPGFINEAGVRMLTLPGDPLYPAIPGWEVPDDTRFVLEEGKGWKPVRP